MCPVSRDPAGCADGRVWGSLAELGIAFALTLRSSEAEARFIVLFAQRGWRLTD